MTTALRRHSWMLVALLAVILVGSLRAAGWLDSLEQRAADLRARLLKREVGSDIVIVGIDPRSLADLQQWPWPRRYHARLLEQLAQAEPRQVFFDIDFSTPGAAQEDAQLEAALARFAQTPVILPAFFQAASSDGGELAYTHPLASLRRHATVGGVNFRPDPDGLIRRVALAWDFTGTRVPSVAALIAGVPATPGRDVPLDFSISPTSFGFVSYVDLLAGRIAASELRGKTVLVGATAIELGDIKAVPIYQAQPGVVVQALAAESLRAGALRTLPAWLDALLVIVLAMLSAACFIRCEWRSNVAVLSGALLAIAALNLYAYATQRLALEAVPAALTLGSVFVIATLRSLDQQTLLTLAYALGIRRREALLGSVLESSTDCVLVVNHLGQIETVNAAGASLFGADRQAMPGMPISNFVPVLGAEPAGAAMAARAGAVSEHLARSAGGKEFPIEISIGRVEVEREALYTIVVRDISARKAQERRLRYQATHDSLTALPNRTALMARLHESLEQARAGGQVALLMLDLCRFKEVNDTLGHDIGDEVLREVARRFEAVAGTGFVARLGGDEFTLLIEAAAEPQIVTLATALQESLRRPISAAGIALDIGLSIGIALFPQHASDAATLLRRADVAMYVAKRRRSPFAIYDSASDVNSVRRLALVSDLRTAIAGNQLTLHYQPQVDLRTKQVTAVEALLRWPHPEYGAVSPDEFIAVAESTDLIQPLTAWTIAQALRQAASWQQLGFAPRIAVNLSARLLQDNDFPALLRTLLESHQIAPRHLELEITESAMVHDPQQALRVIRDIHQLGIAMAIDDFGTGFSSLGYLKDLPVQALKLDKSFVMQLHERAENRSIVNSTVRMAHELGLHVIAEGVETGWAADYLARAGYDRAQGYHYTRALGAADCREWVLAFNARQQHGARELQSRQLPRLRDARL